MTVLPKGIKLWIQEGPGIPHLIWYPSRAVTYTLSKQYDFFSSRSVLRCKDELFTYCYDEEEMLVIGKKFEERHTKDKEYTKNLIKEWENRVELYYSVLKEIDKEDLSKLSDKELSALFKKLKSSYLEEYAAPIVADSVGYYCEVELPKELKEVLKKKGISDNITSYLTRLTQPSEISFIQEERDELMMLVKDFSAKKDISEKLKEHAKKWYWLQNNYRRVLRLGEEYFLDRIKEHEKKMPEAIELVDKEPLLREIEASERLRLLIDMLDQHAIWQDRRKKANLIAQEYITRFLKECSRRYEVDFDDLRYTTGTEVENFLDGKELNWEEIRLRKKVVGFMLTPEHSEPLSYDESVMLDKEIEDQYDSQGVNDLNGTVANVGIVRGTVRVLAGPRDFDKMKEGDVLVTSMTRPDFVPVLKKAVAIVTDEGGLTCHAAIVARELGVPCIVGTKVATKLLKDDDVVEVNANHGVVRIVE